MVEGQIQMKIPWIEARRLKGGREITMGSRITRTGNAQGSKIGDVVARKWSGLDQLRSGGHGEGMILRGSSHVPDNARGNRAEAADLEVS
jgi:hypothetical protein